MKWLLGMFVLAATVACSPAGTVDSVPAVPGPADPTPPVAEEKPTDPAVGPAETMVLSSPTVVPSPMPPTDVLTAAPLASATVTPAPATPEPEPSPTEAVVVNGTFENTYFRGASTAPVTMIDYSDFL